MGRLILGPLEEFVEGDFCLVVTLSRVVGLLHLSEHNAISDIQGDHRSRLNRSRKHHAKTRRRDPFYHCESVFQYAGNAGRCPDLNRQPNIFPGCRGSGGQDPRPDEAGADPGPLAVNHFELAPAGVILQGETPPDIDRPGRSQLKEPVVDTADVRRNSFGRAVGCKQLNGQLKVSVRFGDSGRFCFRHLELSLGT